MPCIGLALHNFMNSIPNSIPRGQSTLLASIKS